MRNSQPSQKIQKIIQQVKLLKDGTLLLTTQKYIIYTTAYR